MKTETITLEMYSALKKLMSLPYLNSFNLAGGTALSLQIGHRLSIDIDLFSSDNFDKNELHQRIEEDFTCRDFITTDISIRGFIGNVALDLVCFKYPLIKPLRVEDQIRMVSIEDLAAMKLFAISSSGERIKDYVDIANLSDYFSLNQMIEYFTQKFGADSIHVLRSISDFTRLNKSRISEVRLTAGHSCNWDDVENRLLAMVDNPNTIFNSQTTPPIRPEIRRKWWHL